MKPTPTPEMTETERAIAIIEARLPLYTDIGQINALRECISSIRSAALSVPAAAVVGEPVAWMHPTANWSDVDRQNVLNHCVKDGDLPVPLYAAPSAPEGWKPIETAPRDGTVILARYQWGGESRFLVIRLSNMHRWWVTDHDGLIKHDEEKVSIRNYNFTHWRPLPAPPALGGSHDD